VKTTPIDQNVVEKLKSDLSISDPGRASIREIVRLVNAIENQCDIKYVRMEMGVPGLPAPRIGIQAEIDALNNGVAAIYPNIEGIPELKKEGSRFLKLFLDINLQATGITPTVGSMQAGMATFLTACRATENKNKVLFIDPGFPVQKQQLQILGIPFESFDVYDYRGDKLEAKLTEYLSKSDIAAILYSNPNNPTWMCLTDNELQTIGKLAKKHQTIVIEDLAYFGMDFRQDFSKPGIAPYPPSVAHYTDEYVLMISGSKSFSYAGQRIGLLCISDALNKKHFPALKRYFHTDEFGLAAVYGALYAISSGTSHSVQYAMHTMLKAANDGTFNFVEEIREYGRKAKIMKDLFVKYGFSIVYPDDAGKPIGDGFYFTISYPGFSGPELINELLYYGISAISLGITGSNHPEGLRACVSQVQPSQFPDLEIRLQKFQENNPH
jgi:aspartate/methionine/tyrosine aminotransferase